MDIKVIGLGHLGAVAAAGLAAAGHDVTGLDIDGERVEAMQGGHIPFYEPGLQEGVSAGLSRGNLRFRNCGDFAGSMSGVALIAAGTPAAATPAASNGDADLSQVRSALAWVKSRGPKDLALVMKSTVPPGSGVDFRRDDLKGLDLCYVSNPEFLREGRALQDWNAPDRIVVGLDDSSGQAMGVVKKMYASIESPFLVTDITSAEMIKYASNAFLATRISFINEIASLCDAVGASIDAVSEGLALDGRMGKRIHAGVGYGGSCLPKDVLALQQIGRLAGLEPYLMDAVSVVNRRQVELPLHVLLDRFGGKLEGLRIGVLGLSFKPGTDDVRESASLKLVCELLARGAEVRAFDPQANSGAGKILPHQVDFVDSAEQVARGAHALALLTEWPEIVGADWETMADTMRLPRFLFDGRNALDPTRMERLDFDYRGVGRGKQQFPGRGEDISALREAIGQESGSTGLSQG